LMIWKKIINKNSDNSLIIIFSILLCMAVFSSGCGRKTLPVPPGQVEIPAVSDLNSSIDNDMLKLAWSIPDKNKRIVPYLDGFIVYKSKTSLSRPLCKNCPVLFKRISDIPVSRKDINKKITWNETLEKGYKYIYKVIGYSDNGATGKDSNYIEFIY